ncbi:MAG: hypothetical protein JW715_12720 [Sedimentisphaerales bacterium]|nr:hypothetical protein [Sedimentisphaerales bacterium]
MTSNLFNVDIFLDNLNGLRKKAGLSKTAFSDLIGVRNAFRRDINGIGYKFISGITRHFPDITEEWLRTEHDVEEFEGLRFTPRKEEDFFAVNGREDRRVSDVEEKVRQLEARIILLEKILSQSPPNPGRRWYDPVICKKK